MGENGEVAIAIDGPAAAGKSTVGRGVARRLDCRYLDTGLMYRAITYLALQAGLSVDDGAALARLARTATFQLPEGVQESLVVNGTPLRDELRARRVDEAVSAVSVYPEVRKVLVECQREMARKHCIVMVGRDIGTVVLPHADAKLWVTASPRTRALRRNREHLSMDDGPTLENELRRISERDLRDSTRPVSPLRQADDAIVLETDDLDAEEAVDLAVNLIMQRLESRSQHPLA
jgi:cytidylate kinase